MKYWWSGLTIIIVSLLIMITLNSFDLFIVKKTEIIDSTIYYYELEDNAFVKKGIIYPDFKASFVEYNDIYVKAQDYDFYLLKKDSIKISEPTVINNRRHKNYIPHDIKILINENKDIYYNNQKIYSLNSNQFYPVIKKYDDKYGIDLNNHLIYIDKSDIKEELNYRVEQKKATQVSSLIYHFFYNDNSWLRWKNNIIGMHEKSFEEQLKYLDDNNYFTVKLSEIEKYVSGIINLPEKSVLLTADDGNYSVFNIAYPLLEKYQKDLVVFGVTAWDPNVGDFNNRYAEVHSHSHNLHQGGCASGQGGLIKCITFEEGVLDIKKSRELLNNSTYFAYPFGEYNQHALNILKEAGITMAFTTNYGKIKPGDNKLLLNRMYIYNNVSLNKFISMIN